MRVTVTSVFLWALLLAARIDARPQELGTTTKAIQVGVLKEKDDNDARNNSTTRPSTSMKPKDVGSRVEPSNGERDLKGYQYMDNSLRTVATQLLNVSRVKEETDNKENTKLDNVESRLGLLIRKPENPVREILSNHDNFNNNVKSDLVAIDTADVAFDRSTNSKYNYFKTSHPGEAMAITEDELERELASSKLMTTHKRKSTTSSGLSTWILLNPPSTTVKPLTSDKSKEINNKRVNDKWTTLDMIKPTVSTVNISPTLKANVTTVIQKNSFTRATPSKVTNGSKPSSTTLKIEKLTTEMYSYTTPRLETTKYDENMFDSTLPSTTSKNNEDLTTSKTVTKRIVSSTRTTKPVNSTPKTTTVFSQATTIKVVKSNSSNQSSKSEGIRKVTGKPEVAKNSGNSTSKIEKVTFKPVQMITTPKNVIDQGVPMFITKLQASLNTDSKSNIPSISAVTINSRPIEEDEHAKTNNVTFTNRVQTAVKQKPTKPNNVLNVQLKRPIETHARIEVQPVKVNAPILKIEKINKEAKKEVKIDDDKTIALDDSKIDVKFVFNPELTKIVETSVENTTLETEMSTNSTTKRPKQKRKKNKTRRRRPSTSTTLSPISNSEVSTINTDTNNIEEDQHVANTEVTETSLQESKIVPESETPSNTTKNKKKQVQKPISSQIYSFLSREVMPSFGMMSLVGLGLGLASYFLYPFGGTISRRNYEVEPNYKYNLNEYGGNYGQSEEEVFSKVLQGMSASDIKYGGMKDFENNYYRYQAYDGAYDPSRITRRGDVRYPTSSVPVYRPANSPMPYNAKYRKNEFQHSDLSTTPDYYERHTETEFMKNQGSAADRQFVVGNVPKGYSYEDKSPPKLSTTTENIQTDFEKQIAQSLKFENPVNVPPSFEQPEAQALKAYEEIEMGPTAVAVEHGPRSLKFPQVKTSAQDTMNNKNIVKIRRKRESFIQQIPTRSELKEEGKEDDLSNEIINIIDSAIPTTMTDKDKSKLPTEDESSSTELPSSLTDIIGDEDSGNLPLTSSTTSSENYFSATIEPTVSSVDPTTDKSIPNTANSSETSAESDSTLNPPITVELGETNSTTVPSVSTMPNYATTDASPPERLTFLSYIKKLAEIKFRIGLTVLKRASENFAKYLDNVQKKLNRKE